MEIAHFVVSTVILAIGMSSLIVVLSSCAKCEGASQVFIALNVHSVIFKKLRKPISPTVVTLNPFS